MRITALRVQNFKAARDVEIIPPADRAIILIAGDNGQGKTSIMNALDVALGGEKYMPPEPVTRGAERAEIRVEIDDGALLVERTIKPDGTGKLVVREDGVPAGKPQTVLNKLIAARFLDPIAFLHRKEPEQRAELLRVIPGADKIATLDVQRKANFDRRTDVARQLKQVEATLANTPEPPAVAGVNVADVVRQRDALREELAEAEKLRTDVVTADREVARNRDLVAELEAQLARVREVLADATARAETAAMMASTALVASDVMPQLRQLDAQIADADQINRRAAAADHTRAQRQKLATEASTLGAAHAKCDESIAAIDAEKRAILAAAKLPVPGLGVDENGVTLNGLPLAQASGAEQLRVALGIAMAASPTLADVWIRDGALLDDRSLGMIEDAAASAGRRLWVERVGDGDDGAIIIEAGTVRP